MHPMNFIEKISRNDDKDNENDSEVEQLLGNDVGEMCPEFLMLASTVCKLTCFQISDLV